MTVNISIANHLYTCYIRGSLNNQVKKLLMLASLESELSDSEIFNKLAILEKRLDDHLKLIDHSMGNKDEACNDLQECIEALRKTIQSRMASLPMHGNTSLREDEELSDSGDESPPLPPNEDGSGINHIIPNGRGTSLLARAFYSLCCCCKKQGGYGEINEPPI